LTAYEKPKDIDTLEIKHWKNIQCAKVIRVWANVMQKDDSEILCG